MSCSRKKTYPSTLGLIKVFKRSKRTEVAVIQGRFIFSVQESTKAEQTVSVLAYQKRSSADVSWSYDNSVEADGKAPPYAELFRTNGDLSFHPDDKADPHYKVLNHSNDDQSKSTETVKTKSNFEWYRW